jgi:hypothetical protein
MLSYGGVAIGDSEGKVERVFGKAPLWTESRSTDPLGANPDRLDVPAEERCPGRGKDNFLRYRGVSFWTRGGRVCQIAVTDRRAETDRGLFIGSAQETMKRRYPKLRCGTIDTEHLYSRYCTGKVGRAFLWFGGDPVDYIELGQVRFGT